MYACDVQLEELCQGKDLKPWQRRTSPNLLPVTILLVRFQCVFFRARCKVFKTQFHLFNPKLSGSIRLGRKNNDNKRAYFIVMTFLRWRYCESSSSSTWIHSLRSDIMTALSPVNNNLMPIKMLWLEAEHMMCEPLWDSRSEHRFMKCVWNIWPVRWSDFISQTKTHKKLFMLNLVKKNFILTSPFSGPIMSHPCMVAVGWPRLTKFHIMM